MKRFFHASILFCLTVSIPVHSQVDSSSKKSKIIDLGDMDVQGELRRPTLFMIESNKKLQSQIEKAAGRKWKDFEDSLLDDSVSQKLKGFETSEPMP